MYGAHKSAYGSKLDLAVKGQTSTYDHHFSNFGRPPVPDGLCKDSAPRHPLFWRRRFLRFLLYRGMAEFRVRPRTYVRLVGSCDGWRGVQSVRKRQGPEQTTRMSGRIWVQIKCHEASHPGSRHTPEAYHYK